MKSKWIASLLLACLPWIAMAQSDDLYFVPKKEKKTEKKEEVKVIPKQTSNTTVYAAPGSTVVVKDVTGKVRDIDEYNRRYTSRDSEFSVKNDTLYVEEKPYNERGEWVNGFEGSEADYEYAMRIVRFRNPRYAIPVSSPLYWDVVYGGWSFWNWNVYDDGFYAYVFPTYTNPLWWNWRWSWGTFGPGWGFSWSWYSPWYYSAWHSPYWYGGYWGGYWGPGWYRPYYPHYGWGGGSPWYGRPHSYNNRRAEIGMPRRAGNGFTRPSGSSSIRHTVTPTFDRNGRTGGRVVTGTNNFGSVRSGARIDRNGNRIYTRPNSFGRGESTYTRPSSTRTNTFRRTDAFDRMQNQRTNRVNRTTTNRSTYSTSRSSGSSFRSSNKSSGGSSRSVGTGGGARRR